MTARRFAARWDGYCAECGERIWSGDEAGFLPGVDGAACADCCDEHDQLS